MAKIPVAVQMYTLREEVEHDFEGTLKKVAELGFDGVEFAGFGSLTAQEVKVLLEKFGLQAAASHVPLEDLEADLDKVIEEQKIIGSNYVVVPFLKPERRKEEDYQALISFLNEAGEMCRREGITLCYHNHDFELNLLSDGRTGLETILENTNACTLKAEFDIYWLTKSGEIPVEWMNRYQNRTPLIHLKDMTTDEEQFFAELGNGGGVDLEAVLNNGVESGVQWWIVEQDTCSRNPFESLEISLNYLKSLK
ncbi:xylose isomerase [Anaerobacillus alkalidiazotrophicus]|uniref:Xylose isomerase n=1 Tax=Anaerobacillus alkalidiazotrophicus TaxID=472963 RepID=A0A1S2MCV9_9BACI|nr:sugar phosphate isomerase/epimerase [Anaerobacillus alkalidiazotrophicus]OIJ22283.1 xylose isomerase [Anaerobacillus alkalidiazotrophicus]